MGVGTSLDFTNIGFITDFFLGFIRGILNMFQFGFNNFFVNGGGVDWSTLFNVDLLVDIFTHFSPAYLVSIGLAQIILAILAVKLVMRTIQLINPIS